MPEITKIQAQFTMIEVVDGDGNKIDLIVGSQKSESIAAALDAALKVPVVLNPGQIYTGTLSVSR